MCTKFSVHQYKMHIRNYACVYVFACMYEKTFVCIDNSQYMCKCAFLFADACQCFYLINVKAAHSIL